MRKPIFLLAGILLGIILGLLAMIGIGRMQDSPKVSELIQEAESSAKPVVDAPAPDFELTALSGEQTRLRDFRGQIILLNFWATWCGPCRIEMPDFQSRFEQYSDELIVLAVNVAEDPEDIQDFMNELDLTFGALLDSDEKVFRQYLVRGLPTTYFIDAEGILRIQHIGVMTEGQLDGYLAELGLDEN
jgi:peroxiredoxin